MPYSTLHQTFGEPRGHSSAVSSVLHSRGQEKHEEMNSGSYIYQGDASSFHEWEFRIRLRTKGKKGDVYVEAASKVVDGLRGDAFVIAQEVGLENLWEEGTGYTRPLESLSEGTSVDSEDRPIPSGIDQLITAMKTSVFPLTTHEAK